VQLATAWLGEDMWMVKKIVKDYTKALQNVTLSGTHQPDFMGFFGEKTTCILLQGVCGCKPRRHSMCYLMMPFLVNLWITKVVTRKREGNKYRQQHRKYKSGPEGGNHEGGIGHNDSRIHHIADPCCESKWKNRLEQNIGNVMINLLHVPDDERDTRAWTYFNKQITENEDRVEELNQWFTDNPSPAK
jgi:hypothetical protein